MSLYSTYSRRPEADLPSLKLNNRREKRKCYEELNKTSNCTEVELNRYINNIKKLTFFTKGYRQKYSSIGACYSFFRSVFEFVSSVTFNLNHFSWYNFCCSVQCSSVRDLWRRASGHCGTITFFALYLMHLTKNVGFCNVFVSSTQIF